MRWARYEKLQRKVIMKKATTYLAAIGGIALFALASAAPASANPGRHHWRAYDGPDIMFDVGPGYNGYDCYDYDCDY
jgi:hypothetical protein